MKIFITGFHRAGTHCVAKHYAKKYGIPYIEESRIRWDSIEAAKMLHDGYWPEWERVDRIQVAKPVRMSSLNNGFVLQCPGLAHKVAELSVLGEVKWVQRDMLNTITSMRNGGINSMAWHLMKGFRDEFPDDLIWDKITYDGSEDNHYGFVKYYSLLCCVKKYFYKKYFSNDVELIELEKQTYYDKSITFTEKKELKEIEKQIALRELEVNESICLV
jgi:hypothetical protein